MADRVTIARPRRASILYDIEEKLFPDYKANPGEKALVMLHTVPYEGSVALINMLTTTRLARKGFETTMVLYGPGVLLGPGPAAGRRSAQEGFPGALAMNGQLKTIMKEGSTIYACRFAMGMLYGHREEDMIPGIKGVQPARRARLPIENWRQARSSSTPGPSRLTSHARSGGPDLALATRGPAARPRRPAAAFVDRRRSTRMADGTTPGAARRRAPDEGRADRGLRRHAGTPRRRRPDRRQGVPAGRPGPDGPHADRRGRVVPVRRPRERRRLRHHPRRDARRARRVPAAGRSSTTSPRRTASRTGTSPSCTARTSWRRPSSRRASAGTTMPIDAASAASASASGTRPRSR